MSCPAWRPLLAGTAAGLLAAVATAAPQAGLRFDQVFADAAVTLHYRAEYQARGAGHQLEAWLDRGTRLKRVTDGKTESYAVRASTREPEYRMTVLDPERRMATRIDRTNLFRLGNFTDWFELAHALRHPRGEYQLARTAAPTGGTPPLAPCDWYRLTQAGHGSDICWSRSASLPMLIVDGGQEVWRVTALDRGPLAEAVFAVHDQGFVHNDANEDIERD